MSFDDPTDPPDKEKLKIRLYFGPVRHFYQNTDLRIKLDNGTDFTIHDTPIKERTSMEYYKVWNAKNFGRVFQFIDEPTNTFVLTAQKNKNEYILTYVHPKYLISWAWDEPGVGEHHNPLVRISGTHQGQEVDDYTNLATGNSENRNLPIFPEFRNTYRHIQLMVGYGRVFNILESNKGNKINLNYTPNISVGVHVGKSFVSYAPFENDQQTWYSGFDSKNTIQGHSLTLGNKIKLSGPKDKFGIFVEHKYNYSKKKYSILDRGTAEHFLNYNSLSIGLHIRLHKGKK